MVHESDNYFRLAVVSGQMLSKLSSQSFFTTSTAAQTNAAYYYSFEGLPTNVAGAYYQCNITNATPQHLAITENDASPVDPPLAYDQRLRSDFPQYQLYHLLRPEL